MRKSLNQTFLVVKLKSSLRQFTGRHHDLVDRYGEKQKLLALPEHLSSLPDFMIFLSIYMSSRVQLCCEVHYDFHVISMFGSSMLLFVLQGFMFYLYQLYLFTFTGPTRFISDDICVTTGAASGTETAYPEHRSPPRLFAGFVVAQSLVVCRVLQIIVCSFWQFWCLSFDLWFLITDIQYRVSECVIVV